MGSDLAAGFDVWEMICGMMGVKELRSLKMKISHIDLPERFSLPLTSLDPRLTVQSVERPGDPLETGSNKEQRTGEDSDESGLNMVKDSASLPRFDQTLRWISNFMALRRRIRVIIALTSRAPIEGMPLISPTRPGLSLRAFIIRISPRNPRRMRPPAPIFLLL